VVVLKAQNLLEGLFDIRFFFRGNIFSYKIFDVILKSAFYKESA